MSDINVDYTYNIPDEQFIAGFDLGLTATFNYTGPSQLIVTIPGCGSGYTQKLDGPVYDDEKNITIDLDINPELFGIASLLWGRPEAHIQEFQETLLEGGEVYQEQTNCEIHDYYHVPVYNHETGDWLEVKQILRDTLTPTMRTSIARGEMFIEILSKFRLADDDKISLDNYKVELGEYKKSVAMPWKYAGVNPHDLKSPLIPMSLVTTLNAIKLADI